MTETVRRLGVSPIRSFRDLEVYRRSRAAALSLDRIIVNFPKYEQYALTGQIRNASRSICANIAEGHAKRLLSSAEFKRFLMISYGSAEEMQVWLDFALMLGYLSESDFHQFDQEYESISKMLYALYNKWK